MHDESNFFLKKTFQLLIPIMILNKAKVTESRELKAFLISLEPGAICNEHVQKCFW